ncbi:dethiobiotin synthase [Sedimentimonas flavescens]|uniref:ATP-dependent dethiobiotin synthetase BioD n=1 Tax=Sedimentimonas flavescens TaxID=2851012 RepID=A0ABT2ZYY9_9RHOB|nr:dethiobiotin synthase [Sedimentimonas flavescens]MCV2878969.1 dethiobiotin synthase [Sedimentimonas flavescens]
MKPVIVTGTDTGVGKTVFAAGLTAALGASYWKPVQAGLEDATDSEVVAALSGRPTLPEAYRLKQPASPHLAAETEGLRIDTARLALPQVEGRLVVEGAGGVMVPLTREVSYLDVFARWSAPVILVARTALGTINHTALSLAALRGAGCRVVGVAFMGAPEPEVEDSIAQICRVRHLGRVGPLAPLDPQSLARAFEAIDLPAIEAAL